MFYCMFYFTCDHSITDGRRRLRSSDIVQPAINDWPLYVFSQRSEDVGHCSRICSECVFKARFHYTSFTVASLYKVAILGQDFPAVLITSP